ncbi:hypothetical protein CBR_g66791 [Chara braunii]|uniref:Reverse transcriptase domain-containing protein n=1 Tax=Chara braunii TaxID=69332 RepID=A0A388K9C8_CHABU|nr:hypothetical protein CBR_g66791 [Chara braunii]|eukprot:GBG66655.1 hypothetical protein CBR_g66791 [Chara braunii]
MPKGQPKAAVAALAQAAMPDPASKLLGVALPSWGLPAAAPTKVMKMAATIARIILDGEPMQVDESLLTGESLAVTKHTGDDLLSGSVIEQGEREALITSTGANTFFGKTMSLLQKETDAGHLTQMLNQVTYIMTSLGFVGSLVIFVVALARGQEFGPTLVYALVVLVSVVPTGMPVVTTTVLAVGARELANEKAIVSRLSAMEEMSGMEDAIDRTVTNAIGNDHSRLAHYTIKRFVPFNPVDKRTEATVVTNEGKTLLISKGAPNIMIDKLDDEKARAFAEQFMLEKAQRGFRTIGIICSNTEGARWQLVGFIPMMDPPREDSQETIRRAHELGIEVKMITGDQRAIAVETARRLGMGTNILPANELEDKHLADVAALAYSSDGFAGVYPEHKFRIVQGAADMILTKPGLSTIITAVTRSRKIFRRLESYVIYRLASSILVLLFTFFSLVALRFQLPSWSLILLSLVNDFTVMSTSLDNVYSSNNPLRWRMGYLLLLSCVIGVMAFVSCFILLLLSRRQSWDWWHVFGIMTDGAPDSKTYAAVFLSLSIAVQLNIFASRTNGFFFYFTSNTAPPPSLWLVLPVCCSCLSSTLISVYWRSGKARGPYEPMRGMSWGASGIVWVYHILFFVLLDAVKVFAVHFAENFPYINVGHLLLAGQLTVENAEKDKEQLRVVQKENRAKLLDKRGGTAADELAVKFALGKPIEARVATLEAENIRLKAALHRIAMTALHECAGMLTQVKDMFVGLLARKHVGGPPDSVTWTTSTTSTSSTTSTIATTVTSPNTPLCLQQLKPFDQDCDELREDFMVSASFGSQFQSVVANNGDLTDVGAAIRAPALEDLLTSVSLSHQQSAEDHKASSSSSDIDTSAQQLDKVLTDDHCAQVTKHLAEMIILEHKITISHFTNWDDRFDRLERRVDDLATQQSKILDAIQNLTAQLSAAKLIAPQLPLLKPKPSPPSSRPSTPPGSAHSSRSPSHSQKASGKATYAVVTAGDQRGPKIPAPNKFRGDDPKTDVGDWAAGTKAYLRGFVCAEQTKVATVLGMLEGPALKWATSTSSSLQQSMEDWAFGFGLDRLLQALEDRFADKERARKAADRIARLGQQRYSATLQALFAEFEQLTSTPGLVMSSDDLLTNFCRAAPEKFVVVLYSVGHKDWRSFGRAALDMEAKLHVQAPSSDRRKGAFPRGGRKGKEPFGLPNRSTKHHIELLPGAVPPKGRMYRMSPAELEELGKQLETLTSKGWIRPSTSEFGKPVLFVPKGNGEFRMCIDYRGLNNITRKSTEPLPRIDDLLDMVQGCTVFSKVDLKSGYHQIEMAEEDVYKTAFKTRYGTYEFLVMPFGFCNAPGTFQTEMHRILRPYLDKFMVVYLDNILVFNRTAREHAEHLALILQSLRDTQYKINREKSSFGVPSVIYLGHVISGDGLAPEAAKIAAIQEWPQPQTVRDVRSFMGLASYYRKFVRNFSAVGALLTNLTKKDTPFLWSLPYQLAFTRLKKALTRAPVLKLPDPTLLFILTTDASQYGIGAVLQQNDGNGLRPVEFMSKKIKTQKLQDSTYEKKLYVLVCALKHWKHFLLGRHFKIFSDHTTLQWMKS